MEHVSAVEDAMNEYCLTSKSIIPLVSYALVGHVVSRNDI